MPLFPPRVDEALALLRPQADGDILDRPAVARHGVALEMGQNQVRIILPEMLAHKVFLEVCSTVDRQGHGAVLIQNDHIGDVCEAVVLCHLIVHGGAGPGASVGGVALHDGAVHLLNHILDQRRAVHFHDAALI